MLHHQMVLFCFMPFCSSPLPRRNLFCLLMPNLFSLLPSLWPIFLSLSFLSWLQSTPALIIADGWWCLATLLGTVDSHLEEQRRGHTHARTCTHSPAESFVSHRMMKSAWSMSLPHLLCRRMPPLPTTAHFFRGSCRGLSWAEGNMQFC